MDCAGSKIYQPVAHFAILLKCHKYIFAFDQRIFTFDHVLNSPYDIFKKCACAILKARRRKALNISQEKSKSEITKTSWIAFVQVFVALSVCKQILSYHDFICIQYLNN